MNFKTILTHYKITIPPSLIAITKGCDDSLSYFFLQIKTASHG